MWHDLRSAFAFLTILPIGHSDGDDHARPPGGIFAWLPLVGLVIGAIVAAAAWLLPPWLANYGALAFWVILTGGLHLDGYADACDGLLATTNPARRLEIMKDPHIGTWALVGVILLLLGKLVAIGQVTPWALIAAPVAGRWAMTLAAWRYPYARTQGTGGYFRQGLGGREVAIATAIALLALAGLSAVEWRVLVLLLVAPATLLAVATFARRRLGGGLTGDIYGAICELTELCTLLAIALLPADLIR